MQLGFRISKLANNFFFISNLVEWHFSCRKDYNRIWLQQTGTLTYKERGGLFEFKKIMTKYGFVHREKKLQYLGKVFCCYAERDVWKHLKKIVTKQEFKKIEGVFKLFEPRFKKIWNAHQLKKRLRVFRRSLKQKCYTDLLKNLFSFLSGEGYTPRITVIPILSPLNGRNITAAGGANLSSRYITLELPELKPGSWELEYSMGVLAHEIGHILFQRNKGMDLIKKLIRKFKLPRNVKPHIQPRYSSFEFLNEILIDCLVPYGYLAQKYFRFTPLQIIFSKSNMKVLGANFDKFREGEIVSGRRLIKMIVWQLYPWIVYNVESRKSISESFVKEIVNFTLRILK